MNKNQLINIVASKTLTKKDAKKIVNYIFEVIKDSLIKGEKVVIQNFGTFVPKIYKSKKMFNPKQNKYISVEPRKKVKFIPSKKFLEILSGKIST